MEEGKIKEAFSKIKEDILNLRKELTEIKREILETNRLMKQINEDLIKIKLEKITGIGEKPIRNYPTDIPTHPTKNPTHPIIPTDNPTHPQEIQGLKSSNLPFSIGNDGVPTDRQTDRQTVRQIHFPYEIPSIEQEEEYLSTTTLTNPHLSSVNVVPNPSQVYQEKPIQQQISEASEILDSLDAIKKDIRRKFKRITKQEMLVFSSIYTLEEQDQEGADYNKISLKLGLSQGSIRDYVHRMINKGIPITKERMNNNKIILHVSKELRRIASLSTIIKLREI